MNDVNLCHPETDFGRWVAANILVPITKERTFTFRIAVSNISYMSNLWANWYRRIGLND